MKICNFEYLCIEFRIRPQLLAHDIRSPEDYFHILEKLLTCVDLHMSVLSPHVRSIWKRVFAGRVLMCGTDVEGSKIVSGKV